MFSLTRVVWFGGLDLRLTMTSFIIDLEIKDLNSKAENAILFIGDGMDITTITTARILKGQEKGNSGLEDSLVWDTFDNVALSKARENSAIFSCGF